MVNYSSIFPISSGGGGSIAGFEWAERTADFTAEVNKAYYCDTALGDVLMTLPPSPAPGDEVAFLLIGANKLNITTTDKIKGAALATDFVKKTSQQYLLFIFFYVDSTTGWNWDARYDSYIGNAYIGADPYFNNVVLFLKGDGANNSTSIIDSSLSAKTISRFGDTKISNIQSKYGDTSIYYNGTGDHLTAPASADWQFGINEYTLEGWFYIPSLKFENDVFRRLLLSQYSPMSGSGFTVQVIGSATDVATEIILGWGDSIIASIPISNLLGSWFHLAITRTKAFVNGVLAHSFSNAINFNNTASLFVGRLSASITFWDYMGYMDCLRITKGVARYSSNFNPETDTFLNL